MYYCYNLKFFKSYFKTYLNFNKKVTFDEFDEEVEEEDQFNCLYCQRHFKSDKGLKIHVGKNHKDLRNEKKRDPVVLKKLDCNRDYACAQQRSGNVFFSYTFKIYHVYHLNHLN